MRAMRRLSMATTHAVASAPAPRAPAHRAAARVAARPWASMMAFICASARPDSRMSRAMREAVAAAHVGVELDHAAGQPQRLLRRSCGASGSFSSTCITSRASSTGPMPRPIGWRPSVIITSSVQAEVVGDVLEQLPQPLRLAPSTAPWRSGPTGMSSTRWVEPAATFFDRIEATIWPGRVDRQRPLDRDQDVVGRATGRRCRPRPGSRAWRARSRSARSIGSSTSASTSIVSAVPAGEVMARDEVFGHQHAVRGDDRHHQHRGAVARDAADAMLVDHRPGADVVLPVDALADGDHRLGQVQHLVAVELELVGGDDEGRQLDLRVARRRRCRARSPCRSSRDSRSPAILRCSAAIDGGGSACSTLRRRALRRCASRAKASSLSPSSLGATMRSSSTTLSTAAIVRAVGAHRRPWPAPGSRRRAPPGSRGAGRRRSRARCRCRPGGCAALAAVHARAL